MKQIHYIFYLILLVFASSCDDEHLTDAFAKSGIIEVEEEVLQFKPQSAAKTIEIKGIISFDIDTSATEQWCKILKVEDFEASNFITCYVNQNAGAEDRETTFDLLSGEQRLTMTVKQLGSSPQILLQRDSVYIGRDTTVLRINVVSNVEYQLSAGDGDWFTYKEETDEEGNTYLIIPVSPNNTGIERIGVINFDSDVDEADRTFVITQSNERVDYELVGEEAITGNIKIKIISATASSTLGEKKIALSYDNDMVSHYQSEWQDIREEPLYLEYVLESTQSLNYIQYTPFSGDLNKGFNLVQIMVKTQDVDYQLATYAVLSGAGTHTIRLGEGFEKPVSVKFIVMSVVGGETDGKISANCAEVGFYSTSSPYSNIFTDATAGELLPNVSIDDILEMEDEFYRNIAYHLYYNTYNMARVRYFEPYYSTSATIYQMMGKYGTLDNATGITVKQGESIIVLAGDLGNESINLRLLNPAAPDNFYTYKIEEGVNRFGMNFSGHLYVDYLTPSATEAPVHLHIVGGTYNGVYRTGDASFDFDKSESEYVDMQGEKVHLLYRKEDLRNTPSLDGLLNRYDQIVGLQQKFIGIEKYNIEVKNRLSFFAVEDPAHFVKGRIESSIYTMDELCDPDKINGEIFWDLSHKIGKVHTIIPMFFPYLFESIPNLYSLYVERELGISDVSFIDKKTLYADAFNNILLPEAELSEFSSEYNVMNEKIVPFWQLELYAKEVLGLPDFYADVHYELQRKSSPPLMNRYFPAEASKVFQLDLSAFFTAWGFGSVSMAPYPSAPGGLKYLTEENVDLFKNPQTPVAGMYMRAGNTIIVRNSENIIAFEVRHSYYPTQVHFGTIFTVENWKPSMTIVGIGVNGEELEVAPM